MMLLLNFLMFALKHICIMIDGNLLFYVNKSITNYKFIKSPECEFADYIRENINNVMEIDQLYLECCFADDLRVLTV